MTLRYSGCRATRKTYAGERRIRTGHGIVSRRPSRVAAPGKRRSRPAVTNSPAALMRSSKPTNARRTAVTIMPGDMRSMSACLAGLHCRKKATKLNNLVYVHRPNARTRPSNWATISIKTKRPGCARRAMPSPFPPIACKRFWVTFIRRTMHGGTISRLMAVPTRQH